MAEKRHFEKTGISPPENYEEIGIAPARTPRASSVCWKSLGDRRAANTQVQCSQPGLRDDLFFLKLADGGKHRPGMMGADRGASGVRRHANRAGCGFSLAGMVVDSLHRCRPQHEGQAEPRRPANYRTHAFLHWR